MLMDKNVFKTETPPKLSLQEMSVDYTRGVRVSFLVLLFSSQISLIINKIRVY